MLTASTQRYQQSTPAQLLKEAEGQTDHDDAGGAGTCGGRGRNKSKGKNGSSSGGSGGDDTFNDSKVSAWLGGFTTSVTADTLASSPEMKSRGLEHEEPSVLGASHTKEHRDFLKYGNRLGNSSSKFDKSLGGTSSRRNQSSAATDMQINTLPENCFIDGPEFANLEPADVIFKIEHCHKCRYVSHLSLFFSRGLYSLLSLLSLLSLHPPDYHYLTSSLPLSTLFSWYFKFNPGCRLPGDNIILFNPALSPCSCHSYKSRHVESRYLETAQTYKRLVSDICANYAVRCYVYVVSDDDGDEEGYLLLLALPCLLGHAFIASIRCCLYRPVCR